MKFLRTRFITEDFQSTASENKKGINSSSISGTWRIHKDLLTETASGCFLTVSDEHDQCFEHFMEDVYCHIFQNYRATQ